MFSPGFGAFGTVGTTNTRPVIGGAVDPDSRLALANQADNRSRNNASDIEDLQDNKADTSALAAYDTTAVLDGKLELKADQSEVDTLSNTVNASDPVASFTALATTGDGGSINNIYCVTSPEYDLSSHPDNNTAVRWLHGQGSEPVSVQMFVRVFDVAINNILFVYPYASERVQLRTPVINEAAEFTLITPVRFVRLQASTNDFRVHRIQVYTSAGPVNGATISAEGTTQMLGAKNVLSASGSAISTADATGVRAIEIDLGAKVLVARVAVHAHVAKTPLPQLSLLSGAPENRLLQLATQNFMDTTTVGDFFHYGELNLLSDAVGGIRAIEVTFDNPNVTRILNTNRDIRPFFNA
jgi:hypothetical protein